MDHRNSASVINGHYYGEKGQKLNDPVLHIISVPPNYNVHAEQDRSNEFKKVSFKGLCHQLIAAGAADISSIALGFVFGYSAVALPQLQHHDSWLSITDDQASWIASVAALSLALGCVMSGVMMERWGRRATMQLQCIPSALGWILIASAKGVPALYAGRFLTGLGGGMVDATCQVYLSEISHPSIRGAISASNPLCFTFGILLTYILGNFHISWPIMAAASGVLPVFGFIALCCVPESPVWLTTKSKYVEARQAKLWLDGTSVSDSFMLEPLQNTAPRAVTKEILQSLFSKNTFRPLCILLAFFFFQQFCGMNAVVFYAVVMFQGGNDSENSLLDSNQSAVLIGLTRFIMTAVTCIMLAHVGRRPLSMVSGIGMAAAMLTLSTVIYVQQSPSPALALPCLAAFIAANTVGFFAVPWVMLGELLPEKCRGFASGLVSAIVYMFIFVVVKFFPYLLSELGQAGVFGLYGTISLIGFVFAVLFLPETHEKTLEEIEKMFQS